MHYRQGRPAVDAAEYRKRLLSEINNLVKSEDWDKYPDQTLRTVLIALKNEPSDGQFFPV